MATVIKTLKDFWGNQILPKTRTKCIYDDSNNRLDEYLGNNVSLNTVDKSVVGAINEVNTQADVSTTNIGDMSSLFTSDKVSLARAINTLPNVFYNPNILINGGFGIWQRGTSFSITEKYTADRWYVGSNGIATQVANTSPIPVPYCIRVMNNGTLGYTILTQSIENFNNYTGKTVTLSFYARSIGGSGLGYTVGAATNRIGLGLTSEWQKFTHTFNSVSLGTQNHELGVTFDAGAIADATKGYELAGVKLELGSIATPYVPRPIAEELMLCQRYYQRGFNYNTMSVASTNGVIYFNFPTHVPMRTTPTVRLVSGASLTNILDSPGMSVVSPTGTQFIQGNNPYSIQVGFLSSTNSIMLNIPYRMGNDIIEADAEL